MPRDNLSPSRTTTRLVPMSADLRKTLVALAGRLRPLSPVRRYGRNPWRTGQLLFVGEPALDKLTAAMLLARDLDLPLEVVRTTALAARYIGETEKNIERVFDEAPGAGCVLFFDEADALFGRRSGVRSSHSRYANQEVSYLLQRAESFRGVVILSTTTTPRLSDRQRSGLEGIVRFPRRD